MIRLSDNVAQIGSIKTQPIMLNRTEIKMEKGVVLTEEIFVPNPIKQINIETYELIGSEVERKIEKLVDGEVVYETVIDKGFFPNFSDGFTISEVEELLKFMKENFEEREFEVNGVIKKGQFKKGNL